MQTEVTFFIIVPPYTIKELQGMLQDGTMPVKKQNAKEVIIKSEVLMLKDVNDDPELRKLIHNMMEMDGGTMMKSIISVCIKQFGERYPSMSPNDWRHLIDDYVRAVTHRPDLKEDEVFTYVMAG